MGRGGRPRLLVPEVVQTSAMDCGPAALAALLRGFGVVASYERLREACHTNVDGTSIDTLEDVANLLGLDAAQVMLPLDHVVLPAAQALPALVVTRLANGFTHFVVAWRRLGPYVQVMDPAVGRRWIRASRFESDLHVHEFRVPADAWRTWATSDELGRPLRRRLTGIGVAAAEAEALVARANTSDGWEALAALDAGTRMAADIAAAGGLGDRAGALVARLAEDPASIPLPFWFARDGGDGDVGIRGAVLLKVRGPTGEPPDVDGLPADVAAVLTEPPSRPNRELLSLLSADGLLRPVVLLAGMVLAGAGTVGEGLLFRRLLDRPSPRVPRSLLALAAGLLVIELGVAFGALQLGRRREMVLRRSLFAKLPCLPDRYLRSRPSSDMAERAHRIHQLRLLPELGTSLVRAAAEMLCTVVGIVVIDPSGAALAIGAGLAAIAAPLVTVPVLAERDLRMRTHAGALARFSLDGLLGLVPIRAHVAEKGVRREHARLMEDWATAGRSFFRAAVASDAAQAAIGIGLAIALVATAPADLRGPGTFLLLAYWAVTVPTLGRLIGLAARQYPLARNTAMRFLEPLGAATDPVPPPAPSSPAPPRINLVGVSVVLAGHHVLEDVHVVLAPGEHVAVVGPSGAGKSTLAGLLLGWHVPAAGQVLIDGRPLEGAVLASLRAGLAWVDPTVQLWNTSLRENAAYGNPPPSEEGLAGVMSAVTLDGVLAGLAHGESIGEGGRLLSGGEGQRLRLARAMIRPEVRLVVLDEAFGGLDRASRGALLSRARAHWSAATLICITHDIEETTGFQRVLVIEGGRVVEDGSPAVLAKQPGSRYGAMLDADMDVSNERWGDPVWERWRLVDGSLT